MATGRCDVVAVNWRTGFKGQIQSMAPVLLFALTCPSLVVLLSLLVPEPYEYILR